MEIFIHSSTEKKLSPLFLGAVLLGCVFISFLSLLTTQEEQQQALLESYKTLEGKELDWHFEIEQIFSEKDTWLAGLPLFLPEHKIFRQISISILSSAWSLDFDRSSVGILPSAFINLHFFILKSVFFVLVFLKLAAIAGIFGFIAAKSQVKAYDNNDLLGLTGSGKLFDSELRINNLLQKRKDLREIPALFLPKISSISRIKKSSFYQILGQNNAANSSNLDLVGIIMSEAGSNSTESAAGCLQLLLSDKKTSKLNDPAIITADQFGQGLPADLAYFLEETDLSTFSKQTLACVLLSQFAAFFYLNSNFAGTGKLSDLGSYCLTTLNSLPTLGVDYSEQELATIRSILRKAYEQSNLSSEKLNKADYQLCRIISLLGRILLQQPLNPEAELLKIRAGLINQQWSQMLVSKLSGTEHSEQPKIYYDDFSISLPISWIVKSLDELIEKESGFFKKYFSSADKSNEAELQILARQINHEHFISFEVALRWLIIKKFLQDFNWLVSADGNGAAVFFAEIIFKVTPQSSETQAGPGVSSETETTINEKAQIPVLRSRIHHLLKDKDFASQSGQAARILYHNTLPTDRQNKNRRTDFIGIFR